MKYPKIQTLFKRDKDNKFVIMPGQYSDPIFEHYDRWTVSEKIHGMNIRVFYDIYEDGSHLVRFGGRTDAAQIPVFLYDKLHKLFTAEGLREVFGKKNEAGNYLPVKLILFGEGFGARIQKGGGNYISDGVGFALFDIYIFESNENRHNRGWWMTRSTVFDVANKLNISQAPEGDLIYTKQEIIDMVKNKRKSLIAESDHIAEGIVARADPPIQFRDGNPVMFKLKVEDYDKLEARK